MGSSKKTDWGKVAKQAIAAGLVSSKDYAKSNLSSGQKSYLSRLKNNYGKVLKNPQDYFVRRVSDKTARRIKGTGHKVENNRIIIQKQSFDHFKIKTSKAGVTFIKANAERAVRSKFYTSGPMLLQKLQNTKMKPGQFITVRFGDKSPIGHAFTSPIMLMKYLEKFPDEKIAAMSIVKFYNFEELDEE